LCFLLKPSLCFLIKVPAVDETLGAAVYLCFPKRVRRELATENESKDPEGFSSTSYWIRAFSQHLGSVAACLPERESRELATENESKDPEGFSSIHTASGSSHNTLAVLRLLLRSISGLKG